MVSWWCKIGFHKWGRASYVHYHRSNILDWKQSCIICGKKITWVQPKGLNEKFYPIYWSKRLGWVFWIGLIAIVYLIYKSYV
jgi:hypothetical protein